MGWAFLQPSIRLNLDLKSLSTRVVCGSSDLVGSRSMASSTMLKSPRTMSGDRDGSAEMVFWINFQKSLISPGMLEA